MYPIKHLTTSAILASAILLCTPASAQSVKDSEEGAYLLCSGGNGPEVEAQACVEWIVAAVTTATYSSRIDSVQKMLSTKDLHHYRIQAESKLPPNADPFMAVRLNLDILKGLNDKSEKTKRWDKLMQWAQKLAPEQRQPLAHEIIFNEDRADILKLPACRKFIEQCRDDIVSDMPKIAESSASLLRQIETTDAALMSPQAQIALMISEIQNKQYLAARNRLTLIENALNGKFEQLTPDVKKAFFSALAVNALPLFGQANLSQAFCFPELNLKANADHHLKLLTLLSEDSSLSNPSAVLGHLMASELSACRGENAISLLFKRYEQQSRDADILSLMDQLMTYAEKGHSERLAVILSQQVSKLSKSLGDFKTKYGQRMTRLALEAGNHAIERGDAAKAAQLIEPLQNIAPDASRHEVLVELGRARSMTKAGGTQARQLWAQVISESRTGIWTEKAYYLSVLSFLNDGKKQEAQDIKRQFSDTIPASQLIQRLPEL